jgi:hypothetical protein
MEIAYCTYIAFRYENELHQTQWSSLRKGAAFGIWMGWLFLMMYIVYPVIFIFGSIFMSYDDHKRLTINDILVVSDTRNTCYTHYFFIIDHFSFCTMYETCLFHWYLSSSIFRSSSCSSTYFSTDWWGKLRYSFDNNILCLCLHNIGTKYKHQWTRFMERRWSIRYRINWQYWLWYSIW